MAGKKDKSKLTPKQAKFVEEYLVDLNATAAARRAGYSEKTADVQGPRLLGNVRIREEIRKAQAEAAERLHLSQNWVLLRLKEISDRCCQAVPVMQFNRSSGEWEETGEYKFDSAGANRATELIAKHLGMFVERVEHTGKLEYEIVLPEELEEKEG